MTQQLTIEQQNKLKEERKKKGQIEMLRAIRAKIMQGLERNNNRSGERAIWELMQNARDLSDKAITKIELTNSDIIFSHQGESFNLDFLTNLIKQQSTKCENDDNVGQYGTGFMATHVFNRKVYISGDCYISYENTEMYVPLPDNFCLDRSSDNEDTFIEEIGNELQTVENLIQQEGTEHPQKWTSFKYDISEKADSVAQQLETTIQLMPYVLVFNDRIAECTIDNKINKETIVYSKGDIKDISFNEQYHKKQTTIHVVHNDIKDVYQIYSLETIDGNDRIIIPPLPNGINDVTKIPSQFVFFPMLGTENFGTNFIFHSSRLYPTEQRNSFQLPEENDSLQKKYLHNETVLNEMIDMLFDFYRANEDEQNLPLDFAKVNFKDYSGDDQETQDFYNKLQEKFSEEFVKWKMIPTDKGFLSIKNDKKFAVLHHDIYSKLNKEQQSLYIPSVCHFFSKGITFPNKDIVEWSKVVWDWDLYKNSYYETLKDICTNIQEKDDLLHTFLCMLIELKKMTC